MRLWLCACLLLPAAPVLSELAYETGAPRAPALSAPALLTQLDALSPVQRLERVRELSATEPVARVFAAVAAKPALIEERRGKLEALLGGADHLARVAERAVFLNVEARADESVLAALRAVAGGASPEALLEKGHWFDGAASAAARRSGEPSQPEVLSPTLSWPGARGEPHEPAVMTLTAQDDGRYLVNGKLAERFRESQARDGVVKELLVHPDDPGLLVGVYHSRGSLAGFERKDERVAGLAPLSQAGAAPRLVEHGEAAIPGKGRVHYFVQELARGAKLQDLSPADRPMDQIGAMLDKLKDAGLALLVPGKDPTWLLANVMIGVTAAGGQGAYLLKGAVSRQPPQEVAANNRMLRAVLEPVAAARIEKPAERLALLDGGGAEARGRVQATAADGTVRSVEAESPEKAAVEAAKLLADPRIAQVRVHRAVKAEVERLANKDLVAMLRLLPDNNARNALIARVPASAYRHTSGGDAAQLLALISDYSVYAAVPDEAWRTLSLADAKELVRRWLAKNGAAGALSAANRWLAANEARLGGPEHSWAGLVDVLALIPEGNARDALLTSLPPATFARMSGAEATAWLNLLSANGAYASFPREAWLAMKASDLELVIRRWERTKGGARQAAQQWTKAHKDAIGSPAAPWSEALAALALLPESDEKDALLVELPIAAYLRLDSGEVPSLVAQLSKKVDLNKLPPQLWGKLSLAQTRAAVERRVAAGDAAGAHVMLKTWLRLHDESVGAEGALAGEVYEALKVLPSGTPRDELIQGLSGEAFERMAEDEDGGPIGIAGILSLVSRAVDQSKVAPAAWRMLGREGVERMIKPWVGASNTEPGPILFKVWLKARAADLGGPELPTEELLALIQEFKKPAERDDVIAAMGAPPRMKSADVAAALSLLSAEQERATPGALLNKLPAEVWQRLERSDMEAFQKRLLALNLPHSAPIVPRLWVAQHPSWADAADALLLTQPETPARDALIAAIPAAAYASAESAAIADVLGRVSAAGENNTGAVFDKLPAEAWKRLRFEDAARLARERVGLGRQGTASVILWLWTCAHEKTLAAGEVSAAQFAEALRPNGLGRDRIIFKLPDAVFAKSDGEAAASLLTLLSKDEGYKAFNEGKVAPEAWRKLSAAQAERVAKHWLALQGNAPALAAARLWFETAAKRPAIEDYVSILRALPENNERDTLLFRLGAPDYEKMTSEQAASVLSLLYGGENFVNLAKAPEAAWRRVEASEMDKLVKGWLERKTPLRARLALKHWLQARSGEGVRPAGAQVYELLRQLPEDAGRDELVVGLAPALYSELPSADAAAIVGLISTQGDQNKAQAMLIRVPAEAWRALSGGDAQAVAKRWLDRSYLVASNVVRQLWLDESLKKPASPQTWSADVHALLAASPESDARDALLARLTPAMWARLASADAAGLVSLFQKKAETAVKHYKALPAEAWLAMRLRDLDRLAPRLGTHEDLARGLWIEARDRAATVWLEQVTAIEALPSSPERDEKVLAVPGVAYAKMNESNVLWLLRLLRPEAGAEVFEKLPEEAWTRLDRQGLESLAVERPAIAPRLRGLWFGAHQ